MQFRVVTATERRLMQFAGVMGLSLVLSSCTPAGPTVAKVTVYPVGGSVFINGKPAARITVKLHPDQPIKQPSEHRGKIVSQAISDEDGNFKIHTHAANDGAPAANYKISLQLLKESGFTMANEPVDLLGGAYADHEKNAADDPEHFTVVVKAQEGDATPVVIPRIDLTIEGFGESEEDE